MDESMRRKIGYDARMIEHSGIGVRIQHILKFWPINMIDAELFVFGDPEKLRNYDLPKHAKIIPYSAKIYSVKEWMGHPAMKNMDLLDIPHFNVPIFQISKCIVTIHDLIPYHFKSVHGSLIKRFYLNFILRLIIRYAKKIVAVSNFTKQDIQKEFDSGNRDIEVIYNGIDPLIFHPNDEVLVNEFRQNLNLPKTFLLSIGIGKVHKNFEFLIRNLVMLWRNGSLNIPLVLGGISKDIPDDIQNLKSQFPDKLIILPFQSYDKLPFIYQTSDLFIFPSKFEGFGFPVLEAQAVGAPVLSSNATVLPEILKDSAFLFDPTNDKDFQEVLLRLLGDHELRISKKSEGLVNSARFHWLDQIKKIKKMYESLLND